jgi:hypothetical protein
MTIEFKKSNNLTSDIIIVDGIWGSGKSLLNPIINNMIDVEMVKYDLIFEYVSILAEFRKLNKESSSFLLNTFSDDSHYSSYIGRNTNFRWSDQSGFSQNPHKVKTLLRIFLGEGDKKINEIEKKNVAAFHMTHNLVSIAQPLFYTFKERIKFIEIIRHPLYLVKHWFAYLSRFDSKRELTISFFVDGKKVPWFAHEWAQKYIESNIMDRCLLSIISLYDDIEEFIKPESKKYEDMLILNFESLVYKPEFQLERIQKFLDRDFSPNLNKVLRKEKIPRSTIMQGKGQKKYGWANSLEESDKEIYENLIDFVRLRGSDEVINNFLNLIKKYNSAYPSKLSEYEALW